MLLTLRKKTSAERKKMTAFQGIFCSEGIPEGRGQQRQQHPPADAAVRSRFNKV